MPSSIPASSTSNHSSNESMTNRIHGMADAMRRDRDEAHRRRLMAEERLRLTQEEVKAMETTVSKLKDQYESLQREAELFKKVPELERSVATLANEVQFQHTELIQKRQKLASKKQSNADATQVRRAALASIAKVSHQRKHHRLDNANDHPMFLMDNVDEQRKSLHVHLTADTDGLLAERWPRVLRAKTQWLTHDSEKKKRECHVLRRIVDGYRDKLKLEVVKENANPNGMNGSTHPKNEGEAPSNNDDSIIMPPSMSVRTPIDSDVKHATTTGPPPCENL